MARPTKNAPMGRPKRAESDAIIQALSARFTPDYFIKKTEQAMALAESQKSSRGMVNVMRFVMEYIAGLPVKRVVHSQDGYDRLADLIEQVQQQRLQAEVEGLDPDVVVIPPKELQKAEK